MNLYETIHLDDYTRSGEGGQGVAYTSKTGKRLAKLFNPGFDTTLAFYEFQMAQAAYEAGVPTPRPYRLITDGERVGTEYELVENKRSFCRIISGQPERIQEISLRFARDSKALHAMPADISRIPSMKARMQEFYARDGVVPRSLKDKVMPFFEQIPDTPRLLHGDLHIGNIITDGERDLWIDIGQFAYGAPEWDLSLCWRITRIVDPKRTDDLFHLTPEQLQQHWEIFASAYYGLAPRELGTVIRRLIPYAAIKSAYMYYITFHQPMSEESGQRLAETLQNM